MTDSFKDRQRSKVWRVVSQRNRP